MGGWVGWGGDKKLKLVAKVQIVISFFGWECGLIHLICREALDSASRYFLFFEIWESRYVNSV